ncbi:MAG: ribosome maturation factor RimP [Bryobacteraceae bacterium]
MAAGNRESIVKLINALAERVAEAEGLELVDADMLGGGGARLVRIYIDKPGGVSHGDCEKVSHEVGALLDAEDVIPGGTYQLEVSSPGVERALKRPKEYERFLGQKARIVLREPVENRKRWEGKLAAISGDVVTLEPAGGGTIQFTLEQVEKANLKFEW